MLQLGSCKLDAAVGNKAADTLSENGLRARFIRGTR